MKTQILKAVAMPARLFGAPMMPAVMNYAVQMAMMVALMVAFPGKINPIIFLVTVCMVHVGLIVWGVKEPHLSQMLQSLGKAHGFWNKEDKIKSGVLDPKGVAGSEGIQINGRQIRVIRIKGKGTVAPEWRKWLMTMARYPVGIQVWQAAREERHLILSAEAKDVYRLREAIQDTLTLLQSFDPQELSMIEAARLWDELLAQKVKYVKESGVFVAQNSQKYAAFVTVNRWGDDLDGALVSELLGVDEGIRVIHQMRVLPSAKANALLIQQRKMAFFTSFSQNIYNQYTAALEAIDTRSALPEVMVQYAPMVRVEAYSQADLDQVAQKVKAVFERYGAEAVREKRLAKACYTAQFPDAAPVPRQFLMLSDNVVSVLSADPEKKDNFGEGW